MWDFLEPEENGFSSHQNNLMTFRIIASIKNATTFLEFLL